MSNTVALAWHAEREKVRDKEREKTERKRAREKNEREKERDSERESEGQRACARARGKFHGAQCTPKQVKTDAQYGRPEETHLSAPPPSQTKAHLWKFGVFEDHVRCQLLIEVAVEHLACICVHRVCKH